MSSRTEVCQRKQLLAERAPQVIALAFPPTLRPPSPATTFISFSFTSLVIYRCILGPLLPDHP